jgi:hypothetical protein
MKRKGFDELINEHVAQARAQGLRRPVITLLFFDSPQARAVWADLNGQPPPPAWTEEASQFTVQAFTVAGDIRLLRQHAGLGGAAVARLLARPPSRPEFWVLGVGGRAPRDRCLC